MPDSLGFSKADIASFIEQKELERDKIIANYADIVAIEKDTLFMMPKPRVHQYVLVNSAIHLIQTIDQYNQKRKIAR